MLEATLPLPDYFEDYADYEGGDGREHTACFEGNDYELAVRFDVNPENETLFLVYFTRDRKLVEHFITTNYDEAILHWDFLNDKHSVSVWVDQDEAEADDIRRDQNRDYFN